jgi:hypothetical protein
MAETERPPNPSSAERWGAILAGPVFGTIVVFIVVYAVAQAEDPYALVRAIAWPATVLAAVILIACSRPIRRIVDRLASRLGAVTAFGVAIELTPETAGQVKTTAEQGFRDYRSAVDSEYARLAHAYRINRTFERLMVDCRLPQRLTKADPKCTFRATLYVEDVLFQECIFQLLDYYNDSGGGNRAFSVRYGIIGRCWRSEDTQVQGQVTTDEKKLISEWGMTAAQARTAGKGRHSFACIPLKQTGSMIGAIYMDAEPDNVFGDKPDTLADGLEEELKEHAGTQKLIEALAGLDFQMRQRGPAIRLFDN